MLIVYKYITGYYEKDPNLVQWVPMHQNLEILKEVLAEEGVSYTEIPGFFDALVVGKEPFIRSVTPFNTEATSTLCCDKFAIHTMLGSTIPMPRTKAFLDPHGRYPEYAKEKSFKDILTACSDFLYPRIIKMNSGEQGSNVFIVKNDEESLLALENIFNKESQHYDYMALVQEYMEPKRELRAAIAGGEFVFAYDRESKEMIEGPLVERLEGMSKTILEHVDLSWGALDFIEDGTGDVYLLEVNTRPRFDGFISFDARNQFKKLFRMGLKAKGLI